MNTNTAQSPMWKMGYKAGFEDDRRREIYERYKNAISYKDGYDVGELDRIKAKSRLFQGDLFTDPCVPCGGTGDWPGGVDCSACKGTGFAGRHEWATPS